MKNYKINAGFNLKRFLLILSYFDDVIIQGEIIDERESMSFIMTIM